MHSIENKKGLLRTAQHQQIGPNLAGRRLGRYGGHHIAMVIGGQDGEAAADEA